MQMESEHLRAAAGAEMEMEPEHLQAAAGAAPLPSCSVIHREDEAQGVLTSVQWGEEHDAYLELVDGTKTSSHARHVVSAAHRGGSW